MAEQIQIATPYGPTEALHWYLSDREIMWQALKELIDGHSHRGVVQMWPDAYGNELWAIEVNDWSGNSATARLGSHLVLTDKLSTYSASQYEMLVTTEGENEDGT